MSYDPYGASAAKTDKGGKSFRVFTLPEGAKFKKFDKNGNYGLDIIPHRVKNKNHPAVRDGAAIGDTVYGFDYWRHPNVGPEKLMVLCPAKTYGKKCPICDLADQMKAEYGPKSQEFNNLLPKHRVLYNVVDPNDAKEEVLLFDESFALFEKEMVAASKNKASRKGKDFIRFADLDEGMTVFFAVERTKLQTWEFNKYQTFDFERRDDPHDDAIIKKTYSPDEFVKIFTYDELNAMLSGDTAGDDDDEDEPAPAKERAHEDDDVDEPTGPVCPDKKKGKTFGKSYDPDDAKCDECELFRDCRKATRMAS